MQELALDDLAHVTGGAQKPGSIFDISKQGVSWPDGNWARRPGGDATPKPFKVYKDQYGKGHAIT